MTLPGGGIATERVEALADEAAALVAEGRSVILVTSGAIGVGAQRLGLSERPRAIPEKQAAAAVGQGLLMQAYEKAFLARGIVVGQVLLTAEDIVDRQRHLNSRNTLLKLWEYGTIPIVNENDTVAVDEIRFGDNDTLSALVATLVEADALILLSDVDGLYTANPRVDKDAQLLSVVEELTPELEQAAGGAGSEFGTGGMATKLEAARIVTSAGIPMVLAHGSRPNVLQDVLSGRPVGTLFLPRQRGMSARKRWLAFHQRVRGSVTVDDGAARALMERGGSLLPAGVVDAEGAFQAGDLVRVFAPDGTELARGLSNYGVDAVRQIRGLRTDQLEAVLGYKGYDEVIHRDNLVVNPRRRGVRAAADGS